MPETPTDWNARYVAGDTPWDSGRPSVELERLLGELALAPGRVLEVGCGSGTNAVYLARRGYDVTAVDVSPLAVERAAARAAEARVAVACHVADLLQPVDDQAFFDGRPFPLIFDRGVYHALREVDLAGFLRNLERLASPGGFYLLLAGNANEPDRENGPPRVRAEELCRELAPLFELVQLREFHFDGIVIDSQPVRPLAWSAVLRRKTGPA